LADLYRIGLEEGKRKSASIKGINLPDSAETYANLYVKHKGNAFLASREYSQMLSDYRYQITGRSGLGPTRIAGRTYATAPSVAPTSKGRSKTVIRTPSYINGKPNTEGKQFIYTYVEGKPTTKAEVIPTGKNKVKISLSSSDLSQGTRTRTISLKEGLTKSNIAQAVAESIVKPVATGQLKPQEFALTQEERTETKKGESVSLTEEIKRQGEQAKKYVEGKGPPVDVIYSTQLSKNVLEEKLRGGVKAGTPTGELKEYIEAGGMFKKADVVVVPEEKFQVSPLIIPRLELEKEVALAQMDPMLRQAVLTGEQLYQRGSQWAAGMSAGVGAFLSQPITFQVQPSRTQALTLSGGVPVDFYAREKSPPKTITIEPIVAADTFLKQNTKTAEYLQDLWGDVSGEIGVQLAGIGKQPVASKIPPVGPLAKGYYETFVAEPITTRKEAEERFSLMPKTLTETETKRARITGYTGGEILPYFTPAAPVKAGLDISASYGKPAFAEEVLFGSGLFLALKGGGKLLQKGAAGTRQRVYQALRPLSTEAARKSLKYVDNVFSFGEKALDKGIELYFGYEALRVAQPIVAEGTYGSMEKAEQEARELASSFGRITLGAELTRAGMGGLAFGEGILTKEYIPAWRVDPTMRYSFKPYPEVAYPKTPPRLKEGGLKLVKKAEWLGRSPKDVVLSERTSFERKIKKIGKKYDDMVLTGSRSFYEQAKKKTRFDPTKDADFSMPNSTVQQRYNRAKEISKDFFGGKGKITRKETDVGAVFNVKRGKSEIEIKGEKVPFVKTGEGIKLSKPNYEIYKKAYTSVEPKKTTARAREKDLPKLEEAFDLYETNIKKEDVIRFEDIAYHTGETIPYLVDRIFLGKQKTPSPWEVATGQADYPLTYFGQQEMISFFRKGSPDVIRLKEGDVPFLNVGDLPKRFRKPAKTEKEAEKQIKDYLDYVYTEQYGAIVPSPQTIVSRTFRGKPTKTPESEAVLIGEITGLKYKQFSLDPFVRLGQGKLLKVVSKEPPLTEKIGKAKSKAERIKSELDRIYGNVKAVSENAFKVKERPKEAKPKEAKKVEKELEEARRVLEMPKEALGVVSYREPKVREEVRKPREKRIDREVREIFEYREPRREVREPVREVRELRTPREKRIDREVREIFEYREPRYERRVERRYERRDERRREPRYERRYERRIERRVPRYYDLYYRRTPPPPPPKILKGIDFYFKPSEKEPVQGTGYDVYAKSRGKDRQINPEPYLKDQALGFGGSAVDFHKEASFRIEKSGEKAKRRSGIPVFRREKFRMSKDGKYYVEKDKHRIDSYGELMEISVKGVKTIKQRKAAGLPVSNKAINKIFKGVI